MVVIITGKSMRHLLQQRTIKWCINTRDKLSRRYVVNADGALVIPNLFKINKGKIQENALCFDMFDLLHQMDAI